MHRHLHRYWMGPGLETGDLTTGGAGGGIPGTEAEPEDKPKGGAPDGADNGNGAGDDEAGKGGQGGDDSAAEIARLRAEVAKQKRAIDDATKEAAKYKRDLRAKQSAEEIAAEEKKAEAEKAAQEIEELRREVAKTKAVKAVMSKLGTDEDVSGKVAEYLYGAEDIDAALTEIQRAWAAKEKALKLEYGRVPPPGAGGAGGEDAETQKALELAKKLGQSRAANNKSVRDGLTGYLR